MVGPTALLIEVVGMKSRKLDGSLCNANVSLTDLIKGWFVALTKQLNAYPSRTLRFASSPVKLVAIAS
jgi:hypothetical protein